MTSTPPDSTSDSDVERLAFTACWGAVSDADAHALRGFCTDQGVLANEARMAAWVGQVVMYARGTDGGIVGLCTAQRLIAPRLGQPMYYWRALVAPTAAGRTLARALLSRSCTVLESHAREHGFPAIGVLLELDGDALGEDASRAVWTDPRFVYIGPSARGLDVRVHYFRRARLKRARPQATPAPAASTNTAVDGAQALTGSEFAYTQCWPRISDADAEAVLAFWADERAMGDALDARNRVREVVVLARDSAGKVAGVSTVVAKTLPQFGQPAYYYRTFVGQAYRHSRLVMNLLRRSRGVLQAHAQAHDFPCVGIVLELENGGFAHKWRTAAWSNPRYDYMGRSPRGLDLRIDYFDDVRLKPRGTAASA